MTDADVPEMVERVAEAIALTGNGGDWDSQTYYKPEHKEFHRKRARAAIKAMHDLSDEMIDAGVVALKESPGPIQVTVANIWWEAIDAALKEPAGVGE